MHLKFRNLSGSKRLKII